MSMEKDSGNDSPSQNNDGEINAETMLNLSLLDPPRWGWSAAGGIVDVLAPHERARRKDAKDSYLELRERRRKRRFEKLERDRNMLKQHRKNHNKKTPPTTKTISTKPAKDISSKKLNGSLQQDPHKKLVNGCNNNNVLFNNKIATTTTTDNKLDRNANGSNKVRISPQQSNTTIDQQKEKGVESKPQHNNSADCAESENKSLEPAGSKPNNKGGISSMKEAEGVERGLGVDKQQNASSAETKRIEIDRQGTGDSSLGRDNKNQSIKPRSVNKDGVLDMFSYHRGREGREPRDRNTGELLCDVEPTDTNHEWDAPNLTTMIKITFSLADDDDDCSDDGQGRDRQKDGSNDPITTKRKRKKRDGPQYSETIEWNLSDPKTPTAMTFAAGVAEDFGLSYCQTLELSASIQKQIDNFLASKAPYVVPLSTKDPYNLDRDETTLIPPDYAAPPQLYGKYGAVGKAGFSDSNPGSSKRRTTIKSVANTGRVGSRVGVIPKGAVRKDPRRAYEVVPFHLLPKHDGPLPVKNSRTGMRVSNGVKFTTEPEYRNEVLKRLKEESQADIKRKAPQRDDGLVGVVTIEEDAVCHICHSRKRHVASFGCGGSSHAFCDFHCSTRLGFSIKNRDPTTELIYDHCPVCSLQCVCPKCCRKLDGLSRELKERSVKQGTKPEDTEFGCGLDVASTCKSNAKKVEVSRASSRKRDRDPDAHGSQIADKRYGSRRKKSCEASTKNTDIPITVAKIPPSEFPREVAGGLDMDPATPDDYRMMYTATGNYIVKDNTPQRLAETSGSMAESKCHDDVRAAEDAEEDGNVDYCHSCQKMGNLLCCDRCPRSFHRECLDADGVPPSDDKAWECFVCARENAGLPEDLADGKKSLGLITTAFVSFESSDDHAVGIQILSIVHQMLTMLMKYEYGEIFSSPVDSATVPNYKEIVKHPMDLGTICANLVNGVYAKQPNDNQSWDCILTAVLKDIELVWHNCFTFNYEGSAIYRMAEVHRRRHHMIQKRSFDHLLSDNVKNQVNEFVTECQQKRNATLQQYLKVGTNRLVGRPQGRNKIIVQTAQNGASKTVAVLDPDSGMVVKLYRSMKGAGLAALYLSDLGHKSEFSAMEHTIKDYIKRSSKDPSALLFGYRWVFHDDLRRRKVRFASGAADTNTILLQKSNNTEKRNTRSFSGFVEMIHRNSTCVFISIEEALSCPDLPSDVSIDVFRQTILGHPPGEKFSFLGRSWRRLLPKPKTNQDVEEVQEQEITANISVCLGSGNISPSPTFCRENQLEKALPTCIAIVKEDLISRRKLLGFDNIKGAYQDWLTHRESSPGFPLGESKELEYFQCYYLDGDRNIDGVVWKTLQPPSTDATYTNKNGMMDDTTLKIEALEETTLNDVADDDSQHRVNTIIADYARGNYNLHDCTEQNSSDTPDMTVLQGEEKNVQNTLSDSGCDSDGETESAKQDHEEASGKHEDLSSNHVAKNMAISTA